MNIINKIRLKNSDLPESEKDIGWASKKYQSANFGEGLEKCTIAIISDNEETPRMHIFNDDGSFACCIDMESPIYHESEFEKTKLTQDQKKRLVSILQENGSFKSGVYQSIWELSYIQWFLENDRIDEYDTKDEHIIKAPDYTKLPD